MKRIDKVWIGDKLKAYTLLIYRECGVVTGNIRPDKEKEFRDEITHQFFLTSARNPLH